VTNRVSVYLLGGQSNMAGETSNASFLAGTPQGNPLPAVQIWQPGFNSFVDLRPGFQNNFGVSTGFGAEIGFGHALEAARANGQLDNEEIYLVKYAIGATTLAVDWNVDGTGNRYDDFTQWVGGALANLANAGLDYTVEGMLWMQGENDAINAAYAASYQANLTRLIGDVRDRYGANMDFVIGRLHEELAPGYYTEADVVRTAQVAVAAANPNTYWVNTDGLSVNPIDGVHFDSAGHLALGAAFANVFIR
jgi:Carbohydrate esterase, sialic acid-specific acetylesterase